MDADRQSRDWFRDAGRIGLVMLLALVCRVWVVSHTEVAARDSIGFIRYALQLEDPPAHPLHPERPMTRPEVLRSSMHPPGYPLAVLAVSYPVRSVYGETSCDAMVRSAQIVSVLAAMLLVIPLYLLTRSLFDQATALIAAGLFSVLPAFVQISSDGLSDSLFLLTVALTLWRGVRVVQAPGIVNALFAGMASGMAYLVRPEGMMLAGSVGLILLGMKCVGSLSWRKFIVSAPALIMGLLLLMGPYVSVIGKLTNKTTGNDLIEMSIGERDQPTWKPRPVNLSDVTPRHSGVLLAAWWNEGTNQGQSRLLWSVLNFLSELLKSGHWLTLPLALVGMWQIRQRIRTEAPLLLLLLVCLLHAALLMFMAWKVGYVSGRHTMLIVMILCVFSASALVNIGNNVFLENRLRIPPRRQPIAVGLLVLLLCLPSGLKPLHANRAGHHQAGLWLAEHATENEQIWDPFCWAEFYAGRTMKVDVQPQVHAGPVYVIVEPNNNPHSRLPKFPEGKIIASSGEIVWSWPPQSDREKARVVIYKAPPVPFPPPWKQ